MRLIAVIWMVIKQVINNLRLEASLLIGLTVAVAVVSSIPIYTNGALQLVFMERWVRSTDPGRMPFTIMFYHDPMVETTVEEYEAVTEFFNTAVPQRLGDPIVNSRLGEISTSLFYAEDDSRGDRPNYANIRFITNLTELIELTDGRMPTNTRVDGDIIEAIVDENALDKLGLLVGHTYVFPIETDKEYLGTEKLRVRVVGTFRPRQDKQAAYHWLYLPPFEKSFFVSEEIFLNDLALIEDIPVGQFVWYAVLDHTRVRVDYLDSLINDLKYLESRVGQLMPGTRAWNYPLRTFGYFQEQAYYLRLFMFVLSVPILGMVLYFVVLAAGLTVKRRQMEIAMLRSRGAGVSQIVFSYILEWGILGVIALAVGPYVGLFIARAMGAASGFLRFVGRRPLPVILSPDAYTYATLGLVTAIIACLVPVFGAARHSVVTYKRLTARAAHAPRWQRYFVDFLLFGFSYYGYRMLSRQTAALNTGQLTSAQDAQLLVDPMLFIFPLLFILAAGLLTLRILPWIMRLLSLLTARWGGVSLGMTTIQMARNPGQYNALILLLILTVASGIYSAATARTLDQNFADRLYYKHGADVVLQEQWSMPTGGGYSSGSGDSSDGYSEPVFYEPPFYVHKQLPGVLAAARVMRQEVGARLGGRYVSGGTLIAIDPTEYAETGWFRRDLAPHHLNAYLNLLIQEPAGVLVPQEFCRQSGLYPGDWVTITLGRQEIDLVIVGTIDYWPTVFRENMPFAVANLEYIQQHINLQPYEVWLRVSDEFSLQQAVESLREQGIWVTSVDDVNRELVQGRREPQRMGLYGMLSIGFLVSVLITVMGFFLYTFLSLRNRFLQFGVLRSIGLSIGQLIAMLTCEQLLSVGVGVFVGVSLGELTGQLFLPFVQLGTDLSGNIPQFIVVTDPMDTLKILLLVGAMLLVGLAILAIILVKMRLHQAVKLGEEI